MDPKAALRSLLEAMRDQDAEEAYNMLESLYGWLLGGGCLPTPEDVAAICKEFAT